MPRRGVTSEPTAAQLAKARRRDAQAVELALAGASYDAIAAELGYADRSGAWRAVRRALDRHEAADVVALREQEVARLDRLQRGLWSKAVRGDVQAAAVVLRLIDRRCRLQGLDVPARVHVQASIERADVADPVQRLAVVAELRGRAGARLLEEPGPVAR